MSLPLVTRFGADPLLDLEVANKQYVDNSGGGGGWFVMGQGRDSLGAFHGEAFWGPFNTGSDAPEPRAQMLISIAVNLRRQWLSISFNTNTVGDTLWNIRDDAVTINLMTIAFGVTGQIDSGDITVAIATGSLINTRSDTAATDGSFLCDQYSQYEPT